MKKGFCIALSVWIAQHALFAAQPTMQFISQPTGSAYTLPIQFGINSLAPVSQNLCGATVTSDTETATCSGLPTCRGGQYKTASFSCSVTTTCNSTVPAKSNCSIALNITKPSTLKTSTPFSFQLSYGSYNALLISNSFLLNGTNPSPPASSYRTITFKNSCNYPVWFGSITGAAPTNNILTGGAIDCTGGTGNAGKLACVAAGGACYARIGNPDACYSQACNADADCMTGASCYVKPGNITGTCFWNNPTPTNQSYQLNNGISNTIQIPQYASNGIGIVWSGAFGGRTGCTSGSCISALCTSGSENAEGPCSLGTGFQQPATQAEPTFVTYPTISSPTPQDAYDITVINGANIPMSMYPTGQSFPSSGNPYTCGAPGVSQPTGNGAGGVLGGSNWNLNTSSNWLSSTYPSRYAYRYVIPNSDTTATRCSTDTDCASSGGTCGLAYTSQSIGSSAAHGAGQLVCGIFAGWFTADQICGTNNSFTAAIDKTGATVKDFQCTTSGGSAGATMTQLYSCVAPYGQSCYTAGAGTSCCGCVNWGSEGTILQVPTNTSYVAACVNHNSTWTGSFVTTNEPQVYNTIFYLKSSCPSCYTYPYDDKSSSFTCNNGSTNAVNYTVEFCQGGSGVNFQP